MNDKTPDSQAAAHVPPDTSPDTPPDTSLGTPGTGPAELSEIREICQRLTKPGYGTVAPDEVDFIQSLIRDHRPASFVEIGMASGISTGFIARFMTANGGKRLVSVDHDDTFFGDTSKPNGFLIPEIYDDNTKGVDLSLIKFKTALDIDEIGGPFDMAFIDANHQHPWPMIDTMALYPHMTGPKLIIHHDLRLFQTQDVMFGIGPKYLLDQFPDNMRIRSTANHGNIFAVDVSMDQDRFETLCMDLVKLPWSLRTQLQPHFVEKIDAMLTKHYSKKMRDQVHRCIKLNNSQDRFRSGL